MANGPNYSTGHMVHHVHANHALRDVSSFGRLSVVSAQGTTILGTTVAGGKLQLRCTQARRLAKLLAKDRNAATSSKTRRPLRTPQGWLALYSRAWHLLAVPLGPANARIPSKMEVLYVFRVARSGDTVATEPLDPDAINFALFNAELVPQTPDKEIATN